MTWTTDEPVEPAHRPIWRRKRWLFVGALAVAAIVATVYVANRFNEVSRQLGAIRALGEPVTPAELAAYYPAPPADQDATRLWLRAFDSIERVANGPATRKLPFLGDVEAPPLVGQSWADIELSRQFLQNNSEAMQTLHDAAALGGQARYPVDFSAGVMVLMDHAMRARNAARCLALEAHVRAHSGDMHGAAESLRAGLLLCESLKNEPLIVSQLVRIAIHNMIIEQLKRIDPASFPAADLERLQETLAHIDFGDGMTRAAAGERVLGLMAFDDPVAAGLPKQMVYFLWINRGADEVAYLRVMSDFVAATELPWGECMDQMDAWTQNLSTRVNRWNVLTNLLTPGIAMMSNAFTRGETVNRLAIVDVAIARYRAHHGRPPTDLAALAPDFLAEIPVDPTTDAPFKYQATADGYLLYSPAKLFRNSTGLPVDAETGANPFLVFRWPPLPDEPKEPVGGVEDDPAKMEESVDEAPADAPP